VIVIWIEINVNFANQKEFLMICRSVSLKTNKWTAAGMTIYLLATAAVKKQVAVPPINALNTCLVIDDR